MIGDLLARLRLGTGPRELVTAVVDVGVVAYLVYRLLLVIRGTRAAQMLIGLVLVGASFFVAKQLELATLSWLIDHLISYFLILVIVVFQQDIRRGLTRIGRNLFPERRRYEESSVIEEVVRAAEQLARSRTGALIVLEREADLSEVVQGGVELEARVSQELLVALFHPDSENALHDGAVIIRNLRVHQAGVVLPLSANPKLDKNLGTRHRAAVGVTEETDAVVVVVSEERGGVSLCFQGNLARDLDPASLRKALLGLYREAPRPRPSPRTAPPSIVPAAAAGSVAPTATPGAAALASTAVEPAAASGEEA